MSTVVEPAASALSAPARRLKDRIESSPLAGRVDVRDLDLPIQLVVGETVREQDGLAMSSRNAYLSLEDRRRAADLSRTLFAARGRAAHGATDARRLEEDVVRQLEAARFQIDYVEAVDAKTMRRVDKVSHGVALTAAVRLGTTRLIDNVYLLDPPPPKE